MTVTSVMIGLAILAAFIIGALVLRGMFTKPRLPK